MYLFYYYYYFIIIVIMNIIVIFSNLLPLENPLLIEILRMFVFHVFNMHWQVQLYCPDMHRQVQEPGKRSGSYSYLTPVCHFFSGFPQSWRYLNLWMVKNGKSENNTYDFGVQFPYFRKPPYVSVFVSAISVSLCLFFFGRPQTLHFHWRTTWPGP